MEGVGAEGADLLAIIIGTYQHCGEQHLQRYLNEFDFRYSNRAALGVNDAERTERAVTS